MAVDIRGKSIAQLATLIQGGALDPVDVTEQTLAAISGHPDQSIFVALSPGRARTEAAASTRRLREGRTPLHQPAPFPPATTGPVTPSTWPADRRATP